MNNPPLFPPAERLGIALMALIRAIAARAGWWIPKWVIALMEDQVRGLVEALSLLAAEVAEGKFAATAEQAAEIPSPVAKIGARAIAVSRTGRKSGRGARQSGAANQGANAGQHAPRPGTRHKPSHPRRRPHQRPPNAATVPIRLTVASAQRPRFSSYAKPAPWHALNVTITKQ